MDQGLKERLIGAAVLVALGVWLIPLVLDGPAQQTEGESTTLRLPAPEESQPVKSVTIELDEQESPPGTGAAAATPVAERDGDEAPVPTPAPAPERKAADVRAETQPAPAQAQRAAGAVRSEPAAVAPAAAVQRPAPAAAAPKAQPAAQDGFMIQLGSFSEEENARRLAQRVGTYGYKPTVSTFKSSGRVMWRVRIGPKSTRAQAEAEASSLSAHGFVAQVVAPD